MENKTYFAPLEVKSTEGGVEAESRTFVGYGATFNNVDFVGDKIAPGAFANCLKGYEASGTMPLMLLNHELKSLPIGVWLSMTEDSKGLRVEGQLIDTTSGRDAYVAMKAGAITGLSIGYHIKSYRIDGPTRILTELTIHEVSVVTIPANDLARVDDVKSLEKTMTDEDLKLVLAKAGFADDAVSALFASRNDEAAPIEKIFPEEDDAEDDTDDEAETKYDEAAMMAAIKSIVATTKEIHVR